MRFKMLFRQAMISEPKKVPTSEPMPPAKLTPPKTAEAMASSSKPSPAVGRAESNRNHHDTAQGSAEAAEGKDKQFDPISGQTRVARLLLHCLPGHRRNGPWF